MFKILAAFSLLFSLSNATQFSLFPKTKHVQHEAGSKSTLPWTMKSAKSRFQDLISSNGTEYEYAQVCSSSEISAVESCIDNVPLLSLDCFGINEFNAKLLRCIEVYCNTECEQNEDLFEFFYASLYSEFEQEIGVCDHPGACEAVNGVVNDPTAAPTFGEYEYDGGIAEICLNGNTSGFLQCLNGLFPFEYEYGREYDYEYAYEYGYEYDICPLVNNFFLLNLHCLDVSCATSCKDIEPIIVSALQSYNDILGCTFLLSCDQFITPSPTPSPTVGVDIILTPDAASRFVLIAVGLSLVVVVLIAGLAVFLFQANRRQTQLTTLQGSNEEKKAIDDNERTAKQML